MSEFVPTVGITLGDPAGIGTEITLRAIDELQSEGEFIPVLFGSREVVDRELEILNMSLPIHQINDGDPIPVDTDKVVLVATSGPEALVPYGAVAPEGGEAAVVAVRSAVRYCLDGEISAICTAPLNKESMKLAGYTFDGHTEMLAEYSNAPSVSMLLIGRQLRVAHLTTHTALRRVPDLITPQRMRSVITIANEAMKNYGIDSPRIAVAGLNPHAGENGLFGSEEIDVMRPVLQEMADSGINVRGPVSGDSVFIDCMNGKYDIVVVAFHDQGHIPVKLVERDFAVNVSGGLPIIRTSVDHGTAFDIAGKGIASFVNMKEALLMAARLAKGAAQVRQPT
jgi:4-hydroxythreonine-4-phosphate dehydrogenase